MPVEPPFHTYREQLWSLYQGLALWKPNSGDLYDRVSIGDVGYVYEGAFIRMFNVSLPWDDESNRTFGIPDRYDPLSFDHHSIRRETFDEVDHYSRCVSRDENANSFQAASPEQADGVAYSCRGRGALLSLPHGGSREDAVQMKIFEKYIQDNVVNWFTWAQKNQLGVERMEDLILVSGCTLVTTWAAAVFTDHTMNAEISLASRTLSNGGASFVWSNVRGPIVHHNSRFDPQTLPTTDQCVFIKGFRAKRVLFRIKPLRAAAESLPDDTDRDGDIHVTPIPGVLKYRDPLTGVLDYIVEKCIESAITEDVIAIAHDDDLHFLEDTNTLTADEIEMHLHERNMSVLVKTGAAMLHVPRDNMSLVSNEKPVTSYEAVESSGESLPLVFHPVLTNYHLKPEMINDNDDPPNTSLLHIPPEIIIRTLQYLSPEDIISCRCICRTMYNICNEPYLRYLVQMERCGVSENFRPGLGYSDRLRILERHEEAWEMLDFRNSVLVDVPFNSTGMYDFMGGTLLLGTRICATNGQRSVGYSHVSLPSLSEQDQKLQWIERDIGVKILDVGLAVHEHDLIAALTEKAVDGGFSDGHMTLEMRLLRLSTGQPHPLAEQPIIYITTKSRFLGPCSVLIEVVGDFLALSIIFQWSRSAHEDMFFLVRWKKGEAHCVRSSDWGDCGYFSFLSQDTLVIPNLVQNTLEIAKVAIKSDDIPCLVPLCVLNLPPLARHASIVRLGCHTEPNPTGPSPFSIPAPSNRPFRNKPEDAIILFSVLIEERPVDFQFRQTRPFIFIVHRRALLNHIPAAHRACAPFCSTPEPAPETVQVPWEAWGPSVTRWFEGDSALMRWITTTAGQRAVTMEDGASSPIIVRDFNPYAVRSARARAAAGGRLQQGDDWIEKRPNGNVMGLKVDESVLDAGSVFKDDVRSSLPYVEVVTLAEYRYQGVFMDEERILGLKTTPDDEFRISSFDVHILG